MQRWCSYNLQELHTQLETLPNHTSPSVWMLGQKPNPPEKTKKSSKVINFHTQFTIKQKQKQKSGQDKNLVKKKSYIHLLVSNILKS
jgi:hypothetical protein